jgi:hypothetical protein
MVFGEPERDEPCAVFPKRTQDHVGSCADLHTMTSSHARVRGAKKYARSAGKYGRGITRRGTKPR